MLHRVTGAMSNFLWWQVSHYIKEKKTVSPFWGLDGLVLPE